MKYRSQHPPPPRAPSRPPASGGRGHRAEVGDSRLDSRLDGRQDSGLDSEWPSGFADTGSSFGGGAGSTFGGPDASHETGLWGRPRRTAAGPVESWHDSSYVLRRGLEVRELSAREWNVCVSAPTPGSAPRRRGDGEDGV
ncbi:MAG: hypothetical protein J7598_25250 [Mitsuaria chitosanitabida]|uniref:hypothetical protein n=1 Tax=Roseateles chitosanitabidus TaxID=65048 RepID=UPI001B04ADFB|nr:hypothetical protein [Roseateles chitosanitabidus]MBO9689921.1 hypothetical protein [Roseateles chitosanitabidus]